MEKKRIIIIDDHPLLRDAWSIILESARKYSITGKLDKSTALLNILREKKADLVILDIGITQLYEFPIIKLIRKYWPLTKIIAVSVQLERSYARKLLRAGASGFLNMDCEASEMLEAVETVLKGEKFICRKFKNGNGADDLKNGQKGKNELTHRELEIIRFVRQGLSSKEIGKKISVAPKTIDAHRRNILKKLKLRNSAELAQFALVNGI